MITNKPMLSVGWRKALADFIEYSVPGPRSDDAMWYKDKQELRAFLDSRAECRCKRYGKDNPNWPCPVHAEPAAQHQGEPVAYADPKAFENFGNLAHLGGLYAHEWMWAEQKPGMVALYAEQPAPVAVDAEILERFPEINFANYGQEEVEALQAWAFEAYEAIARLNGVKT